MGAMFMRLAYNSPVLRDWALSATGGAPRPKEPLGTGGAPPLDSNLAILSRRPLVDEPPVGWLVSGWGDTER